MEKANEAMAIETLLVTDELFRYIANVTGMYCIVALISGTAKEKILQNT